MTSKWSFFLVDSPVACQSSKRKTLLTHQSEFMTERLPGNVPSTHTFVKTCVCFVNCIMTQGMRKQLLKGPVVITQIVLTFYVLHRVPSPLESGLIRY